MVHGGLGSDRREESAREANGAQPRGRGGCPASPSGEAEQGETDGGVGVRDSPEASKHEWKIPWKGRGGESPEAGETAKSAAEK